jgi:hypothetical protein
MWGIPSMGAADVFLFFSGRLFFKDSRRKICARFLHEGAADVFLPA